VLVNSLYTCTSTLYVYVYVSGRRHSRRWRARRRSTATRAVPRRPRRPWSWRRRSEVSCGHDTWVDEWRTCTGRSWSAADSLRTRYWPCSRGTATHHTLSALHHHHRHHHQVSKVIWQKAASSSCRPSRLRMDSSDLYPSWYMVPWTHVWRASPKKDILIGSPALCTAHPCARHTDTHVRHL